MVRLIRILTILVTALSLGAQSPAELPRVPKGESSVLFNFSYAINEFYAKQGRLPHSLDEIRDITDLTLTTDDRPGLKPFTQRYALMKVPVEIPHLGRLALISIDTYYSSKYDEPNSEVRSYVSLKVNGQGGNGVAPRSMIDPYLEQAGISLTPIGGSLPAPTWRNEPPSEPVLTEYGKKVMEMVARGEIPIGPRGDQETWRDQKSPEATPSTVPSVDEGTQPTPKRGQPTNRYGWIIGLIILAAGVVFVARKKKPKA